jgi:FlaG/FlaF family flagellin (archaellin)
MTYSDPRLPEPGVGRNPPRYRNSGSSGIESILVAAIAAAAIIAVVIYSATEPSSTTASNPPPSTTGQGR